MASTAQPADARPDPYDGPAPAGGKWSRLVRRLIGTCPRVALVAWIVAGTLFLALIPVGGWMLAFGLTEVPVDATAGDEKATIAVADIAQAL